MLTGRVPFAEGEEEAGGSLVRRMQGSRYPRLRRLAPETPRALARLVNKCLRSKPGKRPLSATSLRESLERVVGSNPPGACRAEIAAWMWERGVFQPGEDGTVAVPRPAPRRRLRRGRLRWAAAVAICGLCAASALLLGRIAPPPWLSPVLANFVAAQRLTTATPAVQPAAELEAAIEPGGRELEGR